MKKLLFLIAILSILGIASLAVADTVQETVDPKNYPVVWTASVYNGSGATIISGTIVDWDFDTANSTALDGTWYDDMCPYIKLNATDEGVWTAGVVPYGKNIANGETGTIVIRGPAYCWVGTACTIDNLVAANGSGKLSPFDGGANDEATLGVAIKVDITSGQGPDNGADGANGWAIVFVDPTRFDEN